jgi:hypothetical protein
VVGDIGPLSNVLIDRTEREANSGAIFALGALQAFN